MKTLWFLLIAASAQATSPPGIWPQWRGDGTGVSSEAQIPIQWSGTQNVRWHEKVPGFGWSNPIVADGKVFLTTAVFGGRPPLPPNRELPPLHRQMITSFISSSGSLHHTSP